MTSQNTKSTVFIVGAGASVAGGAPVMSNFLHVADQLLSDDKINWARPFFDDVFDARRELQTAFAKSYIDIDNIESLFSVYEMAALLGKLGAHPKAFVHSLPNALRQVIIRTIELSMKFKLDIEEELVRSPFPYDGFVELLKQMQQRKSVGKITIVSFNYDLGLDFAFARAGLKVDYCLENAKPSPNTIALLKPHGSLNWSINAQGVVTHKDVRKLYANYYWHHLGVPKYQSRFINIDSIEMLEEEIQWGDRMRPAPFIVPPTWNKADHQRQLLKVWEAVTDSLSRATNIFVSGYSLPHTDMFFRSFCALSMMSRALVDKFIVFDPNPMQDNWRNLCGAAIKERQRFEHRQLTFAEAILSLARMYDIPEEDIYPHLNLKL